MHGPEECAFTNELFKSDIALDGTGYPVPTGPGLGVEFDEERALEMGFQFSESPHWFRRDGSVTNW